MYTVVLVQFRYRHERMNVKDSIHISLNYHALYEVGNYSVANIKH